VEAARKLPIKLIQALAWRREALAPRLGRCVMDGRGRSRSRLCARILTYLQCGVVLLYDAVSMSDHPRAAVRSKRSVHWRYSIAQDLVQEREPDHLSTIFKV
jgi:hypothetical protein